MHFVISVIFGEFQDPCDLRTSNIRQQLLSYFAVPEQPGQLALVCGDLQAILGDFFVFPCVLLLSMYFQDYLL